MPICFLFSHFQAYELSTLTGTQVMLLVASETGHVYTFATRKLQPMITSDAGKALIQTCLNSPDPPGGGALAAGGANDQRMAVTGYEETELTYNIADEEQQKVRQMMYAGGHYSPTAAAAAAAAQHSHNLFTSPVTSQTMAGYPGGAPSPVYGGSGGGAGGVVPSISPASPGSAGGGGGGGNSSPYHQPSSQHQHR